MVNLDYPYRYSFEYSDNNRTPIQFTILTKEKQVHHKIENMIHIDFNNYINEHKTIKISKNNIIKFLNNNGIDCVNRAYYKSKKDGKR